jgi:hypothetical protein
MAGYTAKRRAQCIAAAVAGGMGVGRQLQSLPQVLQPAQEARGSHRRGQDEIHQAERPAEELSRAGQGPQYCQQGRDGRASTIGH